MDSMSLIRDAVLAVDPSKAAKLEKITATTEIRELGMDSVATMEMVAYVEDQLGVQFADEVLVQVNSFGDLVRLIDNSKLANSKK
jgi:acyl carrier protein